MNTSSEPTNTLEIQLQEVLNSLKNINGSLHCMSDKAEDILKSVDVLTANTRNNLHKLYVRVQQICKL